MPTARVTRFLSALSLALLCFANVSAQTQARQLVTAEMVVRKPALDNAVLSPDGKRVAMTTAADDHRLQLIVLDVATGKANVAASFKGGSIDRFFWVNDKRLVVETDVELGDWRFHPGSAMYAVDADGGDLTSLGEYPGAHFHSAMRMQDSDDIFIDVPVDLLRENVIQNLYRMNSRSGKAGMQPYARPGLVVSWVVDAKNVPRAALTLEKNRYAVHYLDPKDEKWHQLIEYDAVDGNGFAPLAFGADGTLYVKGRQGRDKEAVWRYDFAKGALEAEPVLSLADFDFDGTFSFQQNGAMAIQYASDAAGTFYADPAQREMQARVDKLLPGHVNVLTLAAKPESPNAVVFSYSDVDPGSYHLYDRNTNRLTLLGKRAPWIDPAKMSPLDFVKIKARDGMQIPAWLTTPKASGGKNLPLVLFVHGGPWERGADWRFDAAAQFVASRGYAMLEPEYRGSTGYGFKHYQAGFKQWGRTMQDDLVDAARWAVERGIADARRICIIGSDYGGYAAATGLVRDPDIFKCGVDMFGLTDLESIYAEDTSFSLRYRKNALVKLMGEPDADKQLLHDASPVYQADKLKRPLLLAHGSEAERLPITQATRFLKAARAANADVEWVEYEGDDYPIRNTKHMVDFLNRMDKFLQKHIGAP